MGRLLRVSSRRLHSVQTDVYWRMGSKDNTARLWDVVAQVRAWVEHPFHIVKNLFRHKKLRYRGLVKNTAQLHTLFALANLVIVKKTLLAQSSV